MNVGNDFLASMLPAILLTVLFYVSNNTFQTYIEDNPGELTTDEVYFIAMLMLFLMLASILIGIALVNYFMHKWSEEWNQQFLET